MSLGEKNSSIKNKFSKNKFSDFWKKRRKVVISSLVLLYFLLGLMAAIPSRSLLLNNKVAYFIFDGYFLLFHAQRWSLFAPPGTHTKHIMVTLKMENKWSKMRPIEEWMPNYLSKEKIQERGNFRLFNHLRARALDYNFDNFDVREILYYKLSEYFCRFYKQDNSIQSVLFTVRENPIKPFFAEDGLGRPLEFDPLPVDTDVYERNCE